MARRPGSSLSLLTKSIRSPTLQTTGSIICSHSGSSPGQRIPGEISAEAELPRKFFSPILCRFPPGGRQPPGGKNGAWYWGHQFNKVEMFQYTRPEDSDQAFEELVGKAERLVRDLGFISAR